MSDTDPKFDAFNDEPTAQQIAESIERVKARYGVELSGEAAIRYTRLRNQLRWYLIRDLIAEDSDQTSTDDAQQVRSILKEQFGSEVSLDDAGNIAKFARQFTDLHDKDELAAEMSAIIEHLKVR